MDFTNPVQFSIITPSFRNSQWLKLCIASVADQGVQLEHIVQDGGSDDGTLDWLPQDRRVKAYVEPDAGMYDAINRGFSRAKGEILAHINCDEQYLSGALQTVWQFFDQHPQVEIVFGDVVAIGPKGEFLCSRKIQLPTKNYTRSTGLLCTFTCATFYRHSVLSKYDLWFDNRYSAQGDADWVLRALEKSVPMAILRARLSAFSLTGNNLMLQERARTERREFRRSAPLWIRAMKPAFIAHHRTLKLLNRAYHDDPFTYSIYTAANPTNRQEFQVMNPKHVWPL